MDTDRHDYRSSAVRSSARRRVALIVTGALVVSGAVTLWLRAQPVTVTIDLYPPVADTTAIEFQPGDGVEDNIAFHPIWDERLPGGRVRAEVWARATERSAFFAVLQYTLADGEVVRAIKGHPGGGEFRLLVLDRVLPADVLPGTVVLGIGNVRTAQQPALVAQVRTRITTPPYPEFEHDFPGSPEAVLERDVPLTQWQMPESGWHETILPDFLTQPIDAVELRWDDRAVTARRVETGEPLPSLYDVEVTAVPVRRTRAGQFQRAPAHVYLDLEFHESADDPDLKTHTDPPQSWITSAWQERPVIVSTERYAAFRWSQWRLEAPTLRLMKSADGGVARLRTAAGKAAIDTYAEGDAEWSVVEIPPARAVHRFRAEIPRGALGVARAFASSGIRLPIYAVSIDTWLPPQRWYRAVAPPAGRDGFVVENWRAEREDGLRIPSMASWEHGGWVTAVLLFASSLLLAGAAGLVVRVAVPAVRGAGELGKTAARLPRHVFVGLRRLPRVVPVWLVLAFAVVASIAAYPIARYLAHTSVDVGIDLAVAPSVTPALVYSEGGTEERVPMDRIDDRFAPAITRFEIEVAPNSTATSEDNQVLFRVYPYPPVIADAVSEPPTAWIIDDYRAFTFGDTPSILTLETMGGPMALLAQEGPSGGRMILRTQKGEQGIDLVGPRAKDVPIHLPLERWTRYHARVPRHALGTLKIETDALAGVKRVYVSTVRPRIFFGDEIYPRKIYGTVERAWTPERIDGRIALHGLPRLEQGGWVTVLAVSALLFGVALSAAVTARLAWRFLRRELSLPPIRPSALRRFSWPLFAALAVAFFAAFIPYLALYYPGIQVGDTVIQWREAESMRLTNDHPVLHTLYLMGIRTVWDSWAAVALVQMAGLALVMAFAFTVLYRARVPAAVLAIAIVLALLSPRIAVHSVTIWKDTPYTIFVMLLTVMLALFVLDDRVRRRWGYWIVLGVVLALIPLFRHNGLAVLVAMVPCLIVAAWPYWRQSLLTLSVGSILYLCMKGVLYPAITVDETSVGQAPGSWARITSMRTARHYLAQDPPLANDDYALFADVGILTPEDAVLLYADYNFRTYIRERGIAYREVLERSGRLPEVEARIQALAARFPGPAIDLALARARGWRSHFVFRKSDDIHLGFYVPNVHSQDFLYPASQWMHESLRWLRARQGIFYSQPVIPFYVVLVAAGLWWWRRRDVRALIIYAPVMVNTLALVVVVAGQSDRYHFPLELAAGFLACLPFIPRNAGESIGATDALVEPSNE